MLTPKEALAKDGTIPVSMGRGRLSREGIERCKWLVANKGWDIKGYSLETSPQKSTEKAVVKKVPQTNEKVIQDYVILYDLKLYKAVAENGKIYTLRECCNNCRVSLVQCHCGSPTILGDIPVSILPK